MISPKSIFGLLAVFSVVIVFGYFAIDQQPTTAQELFPSNRVVAPPQTQGFQTTQQVASQGNVQTLIRATYELPADAADKLHAVFEHEATSLVECRIDKGDGSLVDFVVTAEPNTQTAISTFINAVFPRENFEEPTTADAVSPPQLEDN